MSANSTSYENSTWEDQMEKLKAYFSEEPNHTITSLNNKIMKNTTELKGNWNEMKGKLKQRFAMLTDNDLLLLEGKEDEMLGRLQTKLGKTKEDVQKLIAEL